MREIQPTGPYHLIGYSLGGRIAQGTVRSGPVALRLGVATDELGYAIDLGIPVAQRSAERSNP